MSDYSDDKMEWGGHHVQGFARNSLANIQVNKALTKLRNPGKIKSRRTPQRRKSSPPQAAT